MIVETIWKADNSLHVMHNLNMTDWLIGCKGLHEATTSVLTWTQEHSIALQNKIAAIEAELSKKDQSNNGTWWGELQKGVNGLTDKLQDEKPKDFETHAHHPRRNLETVVTIEEHEKDSSTSQYEKEPSLHIMDTRSNKYVLAHPSGIKHLVAHSEDPSLILDIILVLLLGFGFSMVSEWIGLPGFFGCIFAGVLLGPSCLDKIANIVQISSIGQIGALLLLLELGLEFSTVKLFKYSKITILGTTLFSAACSVVWGLFGTLALGSGFKESCFIGFMISFASTPVSIKCLEQANSIQSLSEYFRENNLESLLTGILLMQDALFSCFISLLPLFTSLSSILGIVSLFEFLLKAFSVATFTFMLIKYGIVKLLHLFHEHDIIVLLTTFASLILCAYLGISFEFAAFFSGLSFAIVPESTEMILSFLPRLRELFCVILFVSLGLFIDVQFVKGELVVLIVAAGLVVLMKTTIMFGFCRGAFKLPSYPSLLLSVNLSQVSELSMALGSKGRRLGIISREVYLLFVGSTMISLLVVPIICRVATA